MVEVVDWNELSRRGLLIRINKEILHPIGLAVCRSEDGISAGALVSDDGKWEYAIADPKQAWLEGLDETVDLLDVMDELGLKSVLREVRSYIAHQVAGEPHPSSIAYDLDADYGEECVHEFVPFQSNCVHCGEPYEG